MTHLVGALWTWANATPLHATIAVYVLGVAGAMLNAMVRYATSRDWDAIAARSPRWAGVALVCKGLFPELATMARGALQALTGKLVEKASIVPAAPKDGAS